MPSSDRSLRKNGSTPKTAKNNNNVPHKWRRSESPTATRRATSSPPKRSRTNETAKRVHKYPLKRQSPPLKRQPPSPTYGFRCTVTDCNHMLQKDYNLAIHVRSCHVDSKCGKCGESFVGSTKLARHMKKHHQEDASEVPKWSFCGSCGKEITSNYMATHSLRFHDLTPCLDCGDWFKGLSLLECHLENCEKGAKRDLCDHLLAQTDGRVKLPCPRDKANLIKRSVVGRVPKGREVEGSKSNGVISVDSTPSVKVAAHFVSQPVPSQRFVDLVGNAELDDAATLKAISDLEIDVPSDDDGCLDGTGTADPFLNLNLGKFIEEVFTKPSDKTDVAFEYAVPDMGPLPPLLPSLEPSALGPTLSGSQFSLDAQADVGSDGSLNTVAQEVIVDVTCEFDTQPFRLVPSNNY